MKPHITLIWKLRIWSDTRGQDLIEYALVATARGNLVIASDLVATVLQRYGFAGQVLARAQGRDLEGLKLRHPFEDRVVPVVLAAHVTLDAGTGLVHTAPAHGVEDFQVVRTPASSSFTNTRTGIVIKDV